MRKLSFLISLLICLNSYSQKANRYILDSTSILINTERDALYTKLLVNDTDNAKNIFASLTNAFDVKYLTLWPVEKWLLSFYFDDYKELLEHANLYDSAFYFSLRFKIFPIYDHLSANLAGILKSKMNNIVYKIENSSYSSEEKDFLKLLLRCCLVEKGKPVLSQDTINMYSDVFTNEYSKSHFLAFISENFKRRIFPSRMAFAFDFTLGVGNYTKTFSNSFGQNGFGTLGIELDYNKISLNYRFCGGSTIVSNDFNVNNIIWPNGIHPDISLNEFTLGLNIFDFSFMRITPFSGISTIKLKPIDKDIQNFSELSSSKISMSAYTLGLAIDFKYKLRRFDNTLGRYNNNFGLIRFRYGYNFPSDSYNGNFGNMNYLTIGWGLILRGVRMEK